MPKGHSARPESLRDLRYILERETPHGRIAIAGLALNYATGVTEHTGRLITNRTIWLRKDHEYTDPDLLRALSPNPSHKPQDD